MMVRGSKRKAGEVLCPISPKSSEEHPLLKKRGRGRKGRECIRIFLSSLFFLSLAHSQIWRPPIRISTDTLSHIVINHAFPWLAAKDSTLWVAWGALRRGDPDTWVVFTANYDGRNWSRPIVVTKIVESIPTHGPPRIVITDNGIPHILFGIWDGRLVKLHWSWFDGERWRPLQRVTRNPSPSETEETYDCVSFPNGRIWAIWIGIRENYQFTAAAHYDGNRWSDPMDIDTFGIETNFAYPAITYGRDGRVWALWQRSDVTFSSVYDTSWSPPETVFPSPDYFFLGPPAVCCDSAGNIWAAGVNDELRIIVAVNDGSGWRDHQIISEPGRYAYWPDMVCDSSGRIWVVWTDGQIRARYYERGKWSAITTVCPDTWWGNAYPTIAATNREIWVLWDRLDPITRTIHIYGSWTPISEIGIEEEEEEIERQMFPTVSLGKISLPKNSLVSIYDVKGNKIGSFQTQEDQVCLKLKGLRSGVYFIELKSEEIRGRKKIVLLN